MTDLEDTECFTVVCQQPAKHDSCYGPRCSQCGVGPPKEYVFENPDGSVEAMDEEEFRRAMSSTHPPNV